jgi:hypothetical protein
MGRPLGRKNFGPLGSTSKSTIGGVAQEDSGDGRDQRGVDTTSASTDRQKGYNIPVYKARVSSDPMDVNEGAGNNPYILKQMSSRRFKVYSEANGVGVCKLVDDDGSSSIDAGEMVVRGFVGGSSDSPVIVKKISGRKITGFDDNQYTWYVDNDSTANILVLTAI